MGGAVVRLKNHRGELSWDCGLACPGSITIGFGQCTRREIFCRYASPRTNRIPEVLLSKRLKAVSPTLLDHQATTQKRGEQHLLKKQARHFGSSPKCPPEGSSEETR